VRKWKTFLATWEGEEEREEITQPKRGGGEKRGVKGKRGGRIDVEP